MERYTSTQVATLLGVSEEQVTDALRLHHLELSIEDPDNPGLLPEEAVEKLRAYIASTDPAAPEPEGAKILAITSGQGGVGKTSVTVNLACEFATSRS
jgi:Mrp family chromosome partitioning ATPase